jgi:hypothetical protein
MIEEFKEDGHKIIDGLKQQIKEEEGVHTP